MGDNPFYDEIGGRRVRARGYIEQAVRAGQTAAGLAAAAAGVAQLPYASSSWSAHMPPQRRGRPAYAYGPVPHHIKKYVKRCMTDMIAKKQIVNTDVMADDTPGTGGVIGSIRSFLIRQGNGDADRVGNNVKLLGVTIRAESVLVANAAQGFLRVIIFKDSNTNGAVPAVLDVLETAVFRSGYNADNVKEAGGARFTILKDKFMALNAVLGAVAATGSFNNAFVFKLPKHKLGKVRYDADGGLITDIVAGEIFILALAADATITFQATCELRFQDA